MAASTEEAGLDQRPGFEHESLRQGADQDALALLAPGATDVARHDLTEVGGGAVDLRDEDGPRFADLVQDGFMERLPAMRGE